MKFGKLDTTGLEDELHYIIALRDCERYDLIGALIRARVQVRREHQTCVIDSVTRDNYISLIDEMRDGLNILGRQ